MKVKAEVIIGDNRQALKELPDASVQTVVTSPPYWGLRDYGHDNQIGLEQSPEEFIEQLCVVFDEVWRLLKDDGTIWVNLGDSYAGNNSRASNNGRAGFGNEREGVFLKTGEGLKHKD
jgi:DNA modification methylase